MGCVNGEEELPYVVEEPAASFSDTLLFATMWIVGLPVDVHTGDGSVYSGIFHTASVEGVVLKKAKVTKKGSSHSNVAIGSVVETLVVLSADLVQIVAKGVLLPADGVTGNTAGDELGSATGTSFSHNVDRIGNKSTASASSKRRVYQKRTSVQTENGFTHGDTDTSKLTLPRVNGSEGQWILKHDMRSTMEDENGAKVVRAVNHEKQDGNDSAPSSSVRHVKDDKQVELDNDDRQAELRRKDNTADVHNSNSRSELRVSSGDGTISQVKPCNRIDRKLMPPEHLNGVSCDSASALGKTDDRRPASSDSSLNVISSSMSASPSPQAGLPSQSYHYSHLQGVDFNKKTKDFKLNPGARVFSPAFNISRAPTPPLAQPVAGVSYMPSSSPMLPPQAEVGMGPLMPYSSLPLKVLSYNGIGDMNAHPEPVARAPLLRYAGQNQSLPGGSPFVHPNSQPVMVGRMGQLMYMPFPQDFAQNGAAVSPVFTRPLPTMNQPQFPKHLGNLPGQPLMHPPPLPALQQLYTPPSPMPLMQPPFLTNRPITVPGPNSLYPTKFS